MSRDFFETVQFKTPQKRIQIGKEDWGQVRELPLVLTETMFYEKQKKTLRIQKKKNIVTFYEICEKVNFE